MIRFTQNIDDIKSCAACLSKDRQEHRPHILYLYSDGVNLYGTNGQQVAVAKGIGLEQGFYEVIKNIKTQIWLEKLDICAEYPDLDWLLVDFDYVMDFNCLSEGKRNISTCKLIRKTDIDFNVKFLDALPGDRSYSQGFIDDKMFAFDHPDFRYCFMPYSC